MVFTFIMFSQKSGIWNISATTQKSIIWNINATRKCDKRQINQSEILYRVGELDHAGLGSAIRQTRISAVFAAAFSRRLIVSKVMSTHGYALSDYINPDINVMMIDFDNTCYLTSVFDGQILTEVAKRLCSKELSEVDKMQLDKANRECNLIVDDHPHEYSMGFATCTRPWLSSLLIKNDKEIKKIGTLAVHVRYGDLLDQNEDGYRSERTILPNKIRKVTTLMNTCKVNYDMVIYMERGSKELLGDLGKQYELVSGGKDIEVLRALTNSDWLVMSDSGFSRLAYDAGNHKMVIANNNVFEIEIKNGHVTTFSDIDAQLVKCNEI